MSKTVKGSIMVKYDMEVCAEFGNLEKAKAGIMKHHFVKRDPSEAQYFEFFEVLGRKRPGTFKDGDGPDGKGNYDEDGNRVINGYKVRRLGFIFK
jgi:hypothetical protein